MIHAPARARQERLRRRLRRPGSRPVLDPPARSQNRQLSGAGSGLRHTQNPGGNGSQSLIEPLAIHLPIQVGRLMHVKCRESSWRSVAGRAGWFLPSSAAVRGRATKCGSSGGQSAGISKRPGTESAGSGVGAAPACHSGSPLGSLLAPWATMAALARRRPPSRGGGRLPVCLLPRTGHCPGAGPPQRLTGPEALMICWKVVGGIVVEHLPPDLGTMARMLSV